MKHTKRIGILSLMLSIVLIANFALTGCAKKEAKEETKVETENSASEILKSTIQCIHEKVDCPVHGQVGGEWAVINLALYGVEDEEWYQTYLSDFSNVLAEKQGILTDKKYTEYSRVVMALTALDIGATEYFAGGAIYPIASHLIDRQEDGSLWPSWQGNNGSAYALIALDFGSYLNNEEGNKARAEYIDSLVSSQREDGSWSISESVDFSDVDITAIIVQALAPYYKDSEKLSNLPVSSSHDDIAIAVDKAITFMASRSADDYGSLEACTQVVIALSALGRDAANDLVLGDVLSSMYSYYLGDGMWSHTKGSDGAKGDFDEVATEQAAYALNLYVRTPKQEVSNSCVISITCKTALENIDKADASKKEFIPEDGYILKPKRVEIENGDSAFDILSRVCKENKIHFEYEKSANGAYIEGINNLYEMDVTSLSGWMYKVNEWFPNYGIASYEVKAGDTIEIIYTCNLGSDIGGGDSYGKQ